ncbi:MAG: hypothetical protein P8Z37_03555 [Acidobacteriota bacterium]
MRRIAMYRNVMRKISCLTWIMAIAGTLPLGAQMPGFYEDDPIEKWPQPGNVESVNPRKLSDYYDFFYHLFGKPGDAPSQDHPIRAEGVNTLGEVPDSEWYTNRHYRYPMTVDELQRGAGDGNTPDTRGILTVIGAKTQGVTPGFSIKDSTGRRYLVKFDPVSNPEMATAADIISSKFLYALGYNVPEYYLISFNRGQLTVDPDATVTDAQGRKRHMTERDVTDLLLDVPRNADGSYRAIASLFLEGDNVGEFRFFGTRSDDPNDTVMHERRRDLRGYRIFCAWLNHDDSRAVNTLDMLVENNGVRYIKHFLIDFGSTLGSATSRPNSPRSGNEYLFSWKPPLAQLATLGFYVPRWARADFPDLPSVGRFEWEVFDPETWVPEYYNPAFANCLPEDAFWAAKQVMAFSDEQIRAVVQTGEYSDPVAEAWIATCLIHRRDKIVEVRNEHLDFEDLETRYAFVPEREYSFEWFLYENKTGQITPVNPSRNPTIPQSFLDASPGEYFGVFIRCADSDKTVAVYFRKEADGLKVVGIDRMPE